MKETHIKFWAILLDGELAHFDNGNEYVFAKTKKEAMRDLDPKAGYSLRKITITI